MSNHLDAATVRHVAHLARLKISEDEVADYARQLSRILEYIQQLNELNTEEVAPTAHPLAVTSIMRDDVILDSATPDQALRNAPQRQDNFFRVSKVLDQETS